MAEAKLLFRDRLQLFMETVGANVKFKLDRKGQKSLEKPYYSAISTTEQ